MALDEDYELGAAVDADPDYADEHRDLGEIYRRSQTHRNRMLRQVREGFERAPELAEELMLPHSPLDVAAMAVLGPYGKPATKAAAGALGVLTEPSEAEAALGPGFSKRFFSPLVELVRNLNVNKPMPERAWRELLEPNPKTGKQARFKDPRTGLEHPVTPDEWEFARGDEALKSLTRNGPELIHKSDLADLLEEGYPALDTKMLSNNHRGLTAAEHREATQLWNRQRNGEILTPAEQARYDELVAIDDMGKRNPQPQYGQWRLKGPADDASYQESLTKYERPARASQQDVWEVNVLNPRTGDISAGPRFADEEAATRYMEEIVSEYPGAYIQRTPHGWSDAGEMDTFTPRAGHFASEPNLLSHSRVDRRTTVDGLKARHVDELQSDWHQQARDQGGYRRELTDAEKVELEQLTFRRPAHASDSWYQTPEGRRFDELYRVEHRGFNEDRPPPAPLRKNWHEVELKKQLAQAIEDGDDLLTWTSGEQQIKRYESGLRAQVDEIRWTRSPDGKYTLVPVKNGRPVNVRTAELNNLSDKQLEDTIGTEMAKKIRENKGEAIGLTDDELSNYRRLTDRKDPLNADEMIEYKRLANKIDRGASMGDYAKGSMMGTLSGPDLAVGGAGMRSFYDRTVVDAAKKLAKQYGGEYTKVKLPGEAGSRSVWDRRETLMLHSDQDPERYQIMRGFVRKLAADAEEKNLGMRATDLYDTLADIDVARNSGNFDQFNRDLDTLRLLLKPEERSQLNAAIYPGVEHDVHAIKITPAMREKLKAAGGKFSLYADGGLVLPAWLDEEPRQRFGAGGLTSRELIAFAKRLGVDTSDIRALRELEKKLAEPPAPEKVDLLDVFGSEGQRDLKKRGVRLREKPSYWEDLAAEPLRLGQSRDLAGMLGYSPREYDWTDLYSAAPRGPQSKVDRMPEESTFIVKLPHGRYLADRTGAQTYIRNWLKLPEELRAVDDVERADGGRVKKRDDDTWLFGQSGPSSAEGRIERRPRKRLREPSLDEPHEVFDVPAPKRQPQLRTSFFGGGAIELPWEQRERLADGGSSPRRPRVPGLLLDGNIDLHNRPVVKNTDGSISTVRSMSIGDDEGREILIPTVSDEGELLEPEQAVELYRRTGRHLGIFDSPRSATSFAKQLHRDQERQYRHSGGLARLSDPRDPDADPPRAGESPFRMHRGYHGPTGPHGRGFGKKNAAGRTFRRTDEADDDMELPGWLEDDNTPVELAGGGRASRELAERVRLFMNERGSVPVSELPENTHKLLIEAAPEGFTPIYHGTNKPSVKRWRNEPTYFTDSEGVAETYARTKWPQDPENFGASAKNPSVGAFLVSDDSIGRSLRDIDVTEAQVDMLRAGDERSFSELLSGLFDKLPGDVNKARLRNAVPLSRSMLEERSPKFLRDLYGASPETLQKYLNRWQADPYRAYDHYYVKEPSSLRRWKRGGRT